MTETFQASFTPQELDQLQQLRVSVLAFQNMIAALSADEQNNARNEQFNQLRLEAKALLKDRAFDKKVAKAITQDVLADHRQRVILPRLSGIVMFGVILALLGLGINSVVLDDLVINSLGCLVSSGGMALVIGALLVWTWTNSRQRLSNLGELYLNCNALLYEMNHALNQAIPGLTDHPTVETPETPSTVELLLDSLNKQADDWQQKLRDLEEQRLRLGPEAPLELRVNVDFVQRELNRVRQEIDRWQGKASTSVAAEKVLSSPKIVIPPGAEEVVKRSDSVSVRRAKSVTLDMPVQPPEEQTAVTPEENSD
jgi:hypothetical protein